MLIFRYILLQKFKYANGIFLSKSDPWEYDQEEA
jgi:hypothetical protein